MKNLLLVIMLGIGAGLLQGCTAAPTATATSTAAPAATITATAAPVTPGKISAEDAKTMMADGQAFVLLDVRTQEEFSAQRIPGALLIPDYEIASRAQQELPDKGARILIYCRSGRRSALAAQAMMTMGYTQIYDLGGIIDWPYETVSGK